VEFSDGGNIRFELSKTTFTRPNSYEIQSSQGKGVILLDQHATTFSDMRRFLLQLLSVLLMLLCLELIQCRTIVILQHAVFGAVIAFAIGAMAGDVWSAFFAVGEGTAILWGDHGVVGGRGL